MLLIFTRGIESIRKENNPAPLHKFSASTETAQSFYALELGASSRNGRMERDFVFFSFWGAFRKVWTTL